MSSVLKQVSKFASVGALATGLHVTVALILNTVCNIPALTANLGAFLVASVLSYFGNWLWTFEGVGTIFNSLPRFAFLNLACFAVNQSIVYIVVLLMHLPMVVAMVPIVAIIPALNFWLSRSRVFVSA